MHPKTHIAITNLGWQRRSLLLVTLLLLTATGLWWAVAGKPRATVPAPHTDSGQPSVGALLNADGTLKLRPGLQGSFDPHGYRMELNATGQPRFVAATALSNPDDARWDTRFGHHGFNDMVRTIVVDGTDMYFGGAFTEVGNMSARGIVRYDTVADTWHPFGDGTPPRDGQPRRNGVEGVVFSITVNGNDIYVGGQISGTNSTSGTFTNAGFAGNIVKWNRLTSIWSNLGGGVNGTVHTIAVNGSDVYAGGTFGNAYTAGGTALLVNRIAKWDGAAWAALGTGSTATGKGANNEIRALQFAGGNLYVGGFFSLVYNNDSSSVATGGLARWDGATWSAVGNSGLSRSATTGYVKALALSGNLLYVGGGFDRTETPTNGPVANNLVRWDLVNNVWLPVLSGATLNGLHGDVDDIFLSGDDVYVAGQFIAAGVPPFADQINGSLNHAAKWNSVTGVWSRFGGPGDPMISRPGNGANSSGQPFTIAALGSAVYLGSGFTNTHNNYNTTGMVYTPFAAKWTGAWGVASNNPDFAGKGFTGFGAAGYALAANGTDVYLGGGYYRLDGLYAFSIAKWSSTASAWSTFGPPLSNYVNGVGNGVDGFVNAVVVNGNDVYVAGGFNRVCNGIGPEGGLSVGGDCINTQNIAKWNGTTWSVLGGGLNSQVKALAISGNSLYAAGFFTTAYNAPSSGSPLAASRVARWNLTGGGWSSLGSGGGGVNGTALALAVIGADLYVGGEFSTATNSAGNTVSTNRVAKWNGTSWSALGVGTGTSGNGLNHNVRALAVSLGQLYVGGEFLTAYNNVGSNVTVNHIARWNPATATWAALGSGTNLNWVNALAVSAADVYVGGWFTQAGGVNASGIAKWNGTNWYALGSGATIPNALAVAGNKVYVADVGIMGCTLARGFGSYQFDATSTAVANVSVPLNPAPQLVALSATVTGAGSSGNVSFTVKSGGTVIGTPVSAAVSGGVAAANYTLPGGTPVGNYTIEAVYTGPGNLGSSIGTGVLNVFCDPPVITGQPAGQTVCGGAAATFSVMATGTNTGYQWRKDGVNIGGATAASLILNAVTPGDAGGYDVVVTGACGVATSMVVALTVNPATAITTQPASQTVCAGTAASFSVAASGASLSYQWRKDGANIGGATGSSYAIAAAGANDAAQYDVVVSGACGTLTSNTAVLTVNATTAINTQPSSQTVCAGANVTFSVGATGTGLTYQWRKDGANIGGATAASLTLNPVTAGDAASYDVVVSGACGTLTSSAAALTVNPLTAINTPPASQTVCAGASATFSVTATGASLTYQWRKGGANISGATAASLTLNAVTAGDAAGYDVIVTGACGMQTSAAASLTVQPLTAISTQPAAQTVCAGAAATFNVAATGASLTYQWRKDGVNIGGATGSSYNIAAAAVGDAANYDVVVSGACGTATSPAVGLTVNPLTSISAQPVNQTVCAGGATSFSVTATGAGLAYQWRKGGTPISGATSGTYSIAAAAAAEAGSYDVVVTGVCGTVTSTAATLTVNALTAITTQPADQTACAGAAATFSVAASGTGLSYQWRKGGVNIGGATGASLNLTALTAGDAGSYEVVVSGACGSVTSSAATLTVNAAPAISTQPANQTVCAGSPATFSVSATGTNLTYQWRKGGAPLPGATAASFTLNATTAGDAGSYDVIVSGACGSVTANAATLTVNALTAISTPPSSQTICAGSSATFSVAASGTGLSYQWRKGGVNIAGATAASYTLAAVTAADAASYEVVVSGVCGNATSTVATLTVNPATIITAQPASLTRTAGQSASFSVTASGLNLSYQWRKNGNAISGATASNYSIAAVTTGDADDYDVAVSGACGNVTSNVAVLTVNGGGGCGTPVVSLTAPASGAIYPVGTTINFSGAFTGSTGQPHTANWNFTSNLVNANQSGTVNETAGTVSASRGFTQAGVYQVTLTVTNNCGNSGSANSLGVDQLSALVVIYDPSAGFVTGGGWINSPLGAYVPNPSLTGKANFGFVAKYQNGAGVPTGNTEFQFKAGNLNFKSTVYEWLVIAGARAQFRGSGTINGAGDYRFMLTAIDGQVNGGGGQDKFRIRIWNNAGGGLVYDNQLNDPDSADPTTVLGGGSIVIHRNGGNAAAMLAARAVNDFDGDGLSDLASWLDGTWELRLSATSKTHFVSWGLAEALPVAADYDADGRYDLAVWQPNAARWHVQLSGSQQIHEEIFGQAGDVPVPGDYDGDGRVELAVWRAAESAWLVQANREVLTVRVPALPGRWLPVAGDFDGDGRSDVALFRAEDAMWLIRPSSNEQWRAQRWGAFGDVPVPADYDGDGRADFAVWRAATGEWLIHNSADGTFQRHVQLVRDGKPVAGDYDGDGKADAALWQAHAPRWWWLSSTAGEWRVR